VPGLELDLLGGFELRRADGARPALSSKKARALLAFLALSPERSVSRDKVAALLWPDSGDEQARTSLRQTLSVLRRALPDPEGRIVRSSAEGLGVDPARLGVDVTAFEAGIAEAGRADLERAVGAYRGPLMDGLEVRAEPFEEWLRSERARLSDLAARALESLMELYGRDGESDRALSMARELLRLDPLREDIHRAAMGLLQKQKRWNDALRQYDQLQAVLRAELDIAPQQQTQALYEEILRQRDAVERHRGQRSAEGRTARKAPAPDPARGEGKPSIVVLPFDNLSGDPGQGYFADGITEDIITELSRFASLFVIARNSTFAYKDRAVTVEDVHRDLGVQYVVVGSVRRSADRVRVTAQLIEAASGKHIWADRYDRELIDVFELQDELTRGIVAVLPGRVESFETRKIARTPPDDMAAYELLLAGKIHHHRFTEEDNRKSLELLDRAIALDPNYAAAWAWKACVLGQALGRRYQPDPRALFKGALAAVEKALALDENEVECHRILAEISMETRQWDKAERHNERALALNPNDPRLVAQKGELLTWTGAAEQGAERIRMAMRLDPYSSPDWAHLLGRALMLLGRYAEAVEAYLQSSYPRFGYHADMAGCYAKLDMPAEAAEAAARATELKPDFSVADYVAGLVYRDEQYRERHRDLLKGAPLPA
jgi:TolB-like protein/regulator of sirC expression with transglutaminase-like and TPR domain